MTFSSSLQRLFDLSLISRSSAVSLLGSGRLTPRQTPVFPWCVSTSSRPVGRRRWLSLSVRPLRAALTGLVEGRLAIIVDWMSRALQGIDPVCRCRYLT